MLWYLFFIEAHFQCNLHAQYMNTWENDLADNLSCNHILFFHSKMPQADPNPIRIPSSLPPLLFDPIMDWVSATWTQHFRSVFIRA